MAEPKKKKEIKATRRAKIWAESVTDDMIRWFLKHEDDIETVEDIRRDSERGIIECSVTTYWHDDETDEDFPITDEARFTPHKAVLGDYEKADALSDSWELYLFALGVHELQLMDDKISLSALSISQAHCFPCVHTLKGHDTTEPLESPPAAVA